MAIRRQAEAELINLSPFTHPRPPALCGERKNGWWYFLRWGMKTRGQWLQPPSQSHRASFQCSWQLWLLRVLWQAHAAEGRGSFLLRSPGSCSLAGCLCRVPAPPPCVLGRLLLGPAAPPSLPHWGTAVEATWGTGWQCQCQRTLSS